jgi:hypothetical protein
MKPHAAFQQHVIKTISGKLSLQNTNLEERWIIKRFRHVSIHFLLALSSIISHAAVIQQPRKDISLRCSDIRIPFNTPDFVTTWTNIIQHKCELSRYQQNEISISGDIDGYVCTEIKHYVKLTLCVRQQHCCVTFQSCRGPRDFCPWRHCVLSYRQLNIRQLIRHNLQKDAGIWSLITVRFQCLSRSAIFYYFVLWPTNAQLFHKLSYCYMFRHYHVILSELVINTLPSYTSISNSAVGNTIYN